MESDKKAAVPFSAVLAQAAFAFAFFTGWVICCAIVALLLRIAAVVAADSPGEKESFEENSPNAGDLARRYFKRQLLRSKNFLTRVPEALGI